MIRLILLLMIVSSCNGEALAPPPEGSPPESAIKATTSAEDPPEAKKDSIPDTDANNASIGGVAPKLTKENCIDPDLTLVYKDVVLTMCDGSTGVGTYQPVQFDNLVAENIKQGIVIGSITGSYVTSNPPELIAENIRAGVTVSGVVGAYNNRPVSCTAGNQVDCVTTTAFQSADLTNLTAENLKAGVTVNGVTGTYNNRPADCSAVNQVGCVSTNTFKPADLTGLSASVIKSGVTVSGILGAYNNRPADCTYYQQQNCTTDENFVAFPYSGIGQLASSAYVRKGVAISGVVTGTYPSTTTRLENSDGNVPDLDLATFDAKMKSSADFEWFDSAGNRYVRSGDPDLADAANIKDGVTIFGTVGTIPASTAVTPWDIRKGVSVAGVTGKVVLDCQDGDDATAEKRCQVESSWVDMTTVSGVATTCAASAATNCKYMDMVTGLTWARTSTGAVKFTTVSDAQAYCTALNIDGVTGWRVPFRAEVAMAFVDKMHEKTDSKMLSSAGFGYTWTATNVANSPGYYYSGQLANAYSAAQLTPTTVGNSFPVNCVK